MTFHPHDAGPVSTAPLRTMTPAANRDLVLVEQGTREAAAAFLEALMTQLPDARWEVVRTVAEGDLVFLHARFLPEPAAPAYAIADLFRVQDGLIVEHWDVVAGPPAKQNNPNSRF